MIGYARKCHGRTYRKISASVFLGSLSNVGVRAQREQNPRPEGTEVSEPEGDSFEGTVKSYAQNSLQAAKRSVVMQWRDR